MKWILILQIIIEWPYNGAVTTAEFDNQVSCMHAGQKAVKHFRKAKEVNYMCVPKGGE